MLLFPRAFQDINLLRDETCVLMCGFRSWCSETRAWQCVECTILPGDNHSCVGWVVVGSGKFLVVHRRASVQLCVFQFFAFSWTATMDSL